MFQFHYLQSNFVSHRFIINAGWPGIPRTLRAMLPRSSYSSLGAGEPSERTGRWEWNYIPRLVQEGEVRAGQERRHHRLPDQPGQRAPPEVV